VTPVKKIWSALVVLSIAYAFSYVFIAVYFEECRSYLRIGWAVSLGILLIQLKIFGKVQNLWKK